MKIPTIGLLVAVFGAASTQAAIIWRLGDNNDMTTNPESAEIYGNAFPMNWIQEAGGQNALPGNPANTGGTGPGRDIDDDYYFAGTYDTVVDGGAYTPVGSVGANEGNAERAVTLGDPNMRFHFNFDAATSASELFNISFDFRDFNDNGTGTGVFDVSLFLNNTPIGTFVSNPGNLGTTFTSNQFTLADVGASAGSGFDNYVEIKADTGGTTARWSNLDYIQLESVPEPTSATLLAMGLLGTLLTFRRRR